MRGDPVIPAIIASAGERAGVEYRAFLDDPRRSRSTRKNYRAKADLFFRWAESRGLTLHAIDLAVLSTYKAEIAAEKSLQEAAIYLTPVRGVLGSLAAAGILPHDPSPPGQPNGRGNKARITDPPPSISLAELKRAVRELDNWDEDDECFQAGLVMLAPLSLATIDPMPISRFSGVPLPLVEEFAERLVANGCWTVDGKIAVGSDDPDDWAISCIINVLVATGMVECLSTEHGESAPLDATSVQNAAADEVPTDGRPAREEASDD